MNLAQHNHETEQGQNYEWLLEQTFEEMFGVSIETAEDIFPDDFNDMLSDAMDMVKNLE